MCGLGGGGAVGNMAFNSAEGAGSNLRGEHGPGPAQIACSRPFVFLVVANKAHLQTVAALPVRCL